MKDGMQMYGTLLDFILKWGVLNELDTGNICVQKKKKTTGRGIHEGSTGLKGDLHKNYQFFI
jgi:hypothetical protein